MKKLFFLLLLLVFLFNSCDKPFYCGEVRGIETSSALLIYPFNTITNEYFYPNLESRSPYSRDSLEVLDEEGKKFPFVSFLPEQDPINSLRGFYAIKVSPAFRIPQDNDAFEREQTRNIYLNYNYNTSDTLTLVFKAYKDKCDVGQYEYFKIYHRNTLIFTKPEGFPIDFILNH